MDTHQHDWLLQKTTLALMELDSLICFPEDVGVPPVQVCLSLEINPKILLILSCQASFASCAQLC